jgi:hypothetical protein
MSWWLHNLTDGQVVFWWIAGWCVVSVLVGFGVGWLIRHYRIRKLEAAQAAYERWLEREEAQRIRDENAAAERALFDEGLLHSDFDCAACEFLRVNSR